jgi:uncharacterized membrane protein
MRPLLILLAMSYPFVVHAAVVSGSELLTVACVAILGVLLLAPGLRAGNLAAWLVTPIFAWAIFWMTRAHVGWLPLFAPPVLINFFVAWIFARTLLTGQIPLIERLVRLLHEPGEALDPAIPLYARRLTFAWAILLGMLGCINLALALCAVPAGILVLAGLEPPIEFALATWSLFANLLNYLIVGAFFLAEYAYRQHRFPRQPYRNIFEFIRRAAAVGHRAASSRQP